MTPYQQGLEDAAKAVEALITEHPLDLKYCMALRAGVSAILALPEPAQPEPVAVVTPSYTRSVGVSVRTGELSIVPIKGMKQSGLKEGDLLYSHTPVQSEPRGWTDQQILKLWPGERLGYPPAQEIVAFARALLGGGK